MSNATFRVAPKGDAEIKHRSLPQNEASCDVRSRQAGTRAPIYRALRGILTLALLLAAVSLSCSVGQTLVGGPRNAPPTPTKTPRPTFTPLPGALTPQPTAGPGIRGVLPPGVTVEAPGPAGVQPGAPGPGEAAGSTSLILYATETPAPSPTPEPAGPTATPTPDTETNRPPREVGPRAVPTPYVIVSVDKLTGRRGPDTAFPRVGEAARGDELVILAHTPDDAWWQVCCMANQPVWVAAEFVMAMGQIESVPIVQPPPTPVPTAPPPPRPTATITPTPAPPFDIAEGPQFPIKRDDGRLTIWVKVYEGPYDNQKPLPGYMLKVFRDGVDVSKGDQSFGDAPFNSTFPEGNYKYNLKFEIYNAGEANWEIYLAKPGGFRVSPITQFTTMGDSYRNLVVYIAYWLAR